MLYDIVTCSTADTLDVLSLGIEFLKKHLDFDKIIVITTRAGIDKGSFLKDKGVIFIDEDTIMPGLSFKQVNKYIAMINEHASGNTGHFYQQFLKMAYSRICEKESYLIWDADTIPTKPLKMQSDTGQYYFDMKTEFHKPYFITNETLLGLRKTDSRSFISEHMLINTNIMREILLKIEASNSINGDAFWEKILSGMINDDEYHNAVSEYEMYGSYVDTFYPDLYAKRRFKSFRCSTFIWGSHLNADIIDWVGKTSRYKAISVESWDSPSKFTDFFANPRVRAFLSAEIIITGCYGFFKLKIIFRSLLSSLKKR